MGVNSSLVGGQRDIAESLVVKGLVGGDQKKHKPKISGSPKSQIQPLVCLYIVMCIWRCHVHIGMKDSGKSSACCGVVHCGCPEVPIQSSKVRSDLYYYFRAETPKLFRLVRKFR